MGHSVLGECDTGLETSHIMTRRTGEERSITRDQSRPGLDTQQTLEPASQQTEREKEIISWIYYKARTNKNSHIFTSSLD